MIGLYGVGKSSLVRRYVESIFTHDYMPTIGVQISRKTVEAGGHSVNFILWDLAGDDLDQQLQDAYLSHAQAYILVADVSRAVSFERALLLQKEIEKLLPNAPFVLALNKSDLAMREIGETHLARLDPSWTVIPTSARTGQGVEEIFTLLAHRVLEPEGVSRIDEPDDVRRDDRADPSAEPQEVIRHLMRQPRELVIETPQPIEVPAGNRTVAVCMSMVGERNPASEHSYCSISCTCLRRKDVRCRVVSRETSDRIDSLIEMPDNLSPGEELFCQFEVVGHGWMMSKPVRLAIV